MADITSSCLLQHRQLLTCRRGDLGSTIADKLAYGYDTNCYEYKMKLVDSMMGVLCRYNPDATENCLTNNEICKIIQKLYILLPKDC